MQENISGQKNCFAYRSEVEVMKIIMLGAPGSREKEHRLKKNCRKNIRFHIFPRGDIFRANIKNGTELGEKGEDIYGSGSFLCRMN